jgi:capsular polysaccharide biosynthesis protein
LASLVTSGSLVRVLLARWYITVTGLLLSLALAAAAYVLFPPQYSSTGTVVLLPASQRGQNSLLNFDSSLNTTALIVVQGLSAPQVSTELGLASTDKYTVVNGSASLTGKVNETSGPFISFTAQSPYPDESTAIVGQLTAKAQEELKDLQGTLKVRAKNNITIQSVIVATPPKAVWDMLLRTMGIALLLGILITVGAACAFDRSAMKTRLRKSQRRITESAGDPARQLSRSIPDIA